MGELTNKEFYEKHKTILLEANKRGVVHITIIGRILIYDFYQKELETNKKMMALQNTMDKFKVSYQTVYNTINMLQTHL